MTLKRVGLSTAPYGTQLVRLRGSESWLPTLTFAVLPVRKDLIHFSIFPLMPRLPSLNRAPLVEVRANAFAMSRNTA